MCFMVYLKATQPVILVRGCLASADALLSEAKLPITGIFYLLI